MSESKKLIRVELTYDDGSRMWLEGIDDCAMWETMAKGQGVMAYVHGLTYEAPPWKESPALSPRGGG